MTPPPLHSIIPHVAELHPAIWLDNGAELNIIPIKEAGLVRLSIAFKGGRWVEKQVLQSTVALDQIMSGTSAMSAEALSEKLDFYGASLTASASTQSALLTLTCLRRTLSQVLPLLKDIICHAAYEQSLLDIEKEELTFASRANKQNVTYVGKKLLQKVLLGENHPLARSYDETDVEAVTRDVVLDYHHDFINMRNAVIYASGDVDDEVVEMINRCLGSEIDEAIHLTQLPRIDAETSAQQRHDAFIDTPSAQSALYLGSMMPSRLSPEYPAVALTRTILGGYFGSRLMTNIRERLGFTYGISADILHMPESAFMLISTTTPHVHVDQCVEEIFNELHTLQTQPVGEEEMNMAKNYLMGQFCRLTETTLSLASVCITLRESGSNLMEHATMMEQIQSLTTDDIMRCASTHFRSEDMVIAAAHGKGAE